MNTLKGRLIAVFAAIGLIGLGVLGYLSVNRSSKALMEASKKEGMAITNSITQLVNGTVRTEVNVVKLIASSSSLRSMDWEKQRDCIVQLDMSVTGISELWVVDKDGTAHYVDDSTVDLSNRDYVKTAFSENRVVIGDPVKSKKTGEFVVIVAVPIKPLESGKNEQLLCGRLTLRFLQDTVGKMSWGETGYVFIVDARGILLAHPKEEYLGVLNVSKPSKDIPKVLSDIIQLGMKGQSGVAYYPFEGKDKIASYSYSDYTGWVIATSAYADEFMGPVRNMRNTIALITVVLIVLIMIVSYFIAKAIAKPIEGAVAVMNKISTGDLNVDIDDKSSIKEMVQLRHAMEEMVSKISDSMTVISRSAKTVLDRAQDVNAAIEEANATSNQVLDLTVKGNDMAQTTASAVDEASASIEEVAEGAQSGAHNAVEAGEAAQVATHEAEGGSKALEAMVSVIDDVSGAGIKVGEAIDSLNKSVESIGDFVTTITTIADQTNLLALNAAIEAARAGEHGRGFAVVAEEVRKLAEESNQAAQNVGTLIEEITNRTKAAATDQGRVASFMEQLIKRTDETKAIFVELVAKMNSITENVQSIAAAAEEQSASTEEMSSGVDHIAKNTKETAEALNSITRGMEEASRAFESMGRSTEELVKLSDDMDKVTKFFKLRMRELPAKIDK